MSFKEELKPKKDYFMKEYKKEEIIRTFQFMLKRMGKAKEIEGEIGDIKITQIDGITITVVAKTKESNPIRMYKVSLEFDKMENEGFTREAKIASPERIGEVIEITPEASDKEKENYYEGTIDVWDEKEERTKRIEEIQETNYFTETYKKETILKVADIMIENSIKSGEIQGQVQERKIVKIENMTVSVAIKTKEEEQTKIYRLNLNFNQMKNNFYRNEAKINSPIRAEAAIELKGDSTKEEKENYYEELPDFWDMTTKKGKEEKEEKE